MIRVSVVLAFRDAERWLPACLASLEQQEEEAWELVAVNDGSRDGSAAAVAAWARGRPQPVKQIHLAGVGVSRARNAGWAAAQAPLVAFLDADDLALPGRLGRQAERLEADPELQHLLSGWRRIDAAGQPLHEVCPWLEGATFDLEGALTHKAVLPSAWMLRKGALERSGGFDPGLRQAEDVDLLLRLAASGERGDWLKEVLCGYRVHGEGASRQAADQAHGLLWVVNRRLAALAPGHPLQGKRQELLYGTRVWAGWKAWQEGQSGLALELWRTSWGSRVGGEAHSWVHLAENVGRSCARIGRRLAPEELLADPTWRTLETHVVGDLLGRPERALSRLDRLARQLREQLLTADPLWHPTALATWWRGLPEGSDQLADLRLRALRWCEALLELPDHGPERAGRGATLSKELAVLLRQWALICWPEHGQAALQRLQEAFDLEASAETAQVIARLVTEPYPWGAAALGQLATRLPPEANDSGSAAFTTLALPPPASPCPGPDCPPCAMAHLSSLGWRRESLGPQELGAWWEIPPAAEREAPWQTEPFQVDEVPGGRMWLRPPSGNPWGTTHGVGVGEGSGAPLAPHCRRYPHPWPGCPTPPTGLEPAPTGPPLEMAGTVVALADLSAEIHYHWVLDSLPRLGLLLEMQGGRWPADWHLWHNGGSSERVIRSLVNDLAIPAARLIDARQHTHLRAERLLVPGALHPFGWPSRRARAWLRRRFLDPLDRGPRRGEGRRLWLTRGRSARRPVFGEGALLEELERQGLGLEATVLEGRTLAEQAHCIAQAELVVLPHGATLAGLAFARPGTVVLELHQSRYSPCYGHALAAAGALRLVRCEQPAVPPRLYSHLVFEAPICEPIVLDPQRVVQALRMLRGN